MRDGSASTRNRRSALTNEDTQRPVTQGGAFFDVDKTLLPGVSFEMLFVRALLRGRLPRRFHVLAFLIETLRLLPQGLTIARKANKGYLRGTTPSDLREWGETVFLKEVEARLGQQGRLWVRRERRDGRSIILLSGMPELLLEPFTRFFGADIAIGTPLAVDAKGRLTGRRSGPHPYGVRKREIARRVASEHAWKPEDCSAYGDHSTDAHLLDWVGHPYAVDPDPGLLRRAQQEGWAILRSS